MRRSLWVGFLGLLLAGTLPAAVVQVTAFFPGFTPDPVTIVQGDSIQWVSLSGHNVASASSNVATSYDGTGFRSGAVSAVTTYTFQFNSLGTFNYICEAHVGSGMRGSVIVVAPSPTPTASPSFTPGPSPTLSPTFTITMTPAFSSSQLAMSVAGPVPAVVGQPICFYYDMAPLSTQAEVFNVMGQHVASLSFAGGVDNCWQTKGVAPGIYILKLKVSKVDGSSEVRLQRLAITP